MPQYDMSMQRSFLINCILHEHDLVTLTEYYQFEVFGELVMQTTVPKKALQ